MILRLDVFLSHFLNHFSLCLFYERSDVVPLDRQLSTYSCETCLCVMTPQNHDRLIEHVFSIEDSSPYDRTVLCFLVNY